MDDDLSTPGDPRVAEVLAGLDQLDDLEVDQHVAVFETAQATLRRLLTDQQHLPQPAAGPAGA
jgi:hypothetical protein